MNFTLDALYLQTSRVYFTNSEGSLILNLRDLMHLLYRSKRANPAPFRMNHILPQNCFFMKVLPFE